MTECEHENGTCMRCFDKGKKVGIEEGRKLERGDIKEVIGDFDLHETYNWKIAILNKIMERDEDV